MSNKDTAKVDETPSADLTQADLFYSKDDVLIQLEMPLYEIKSKYAPEGITKDKETHFTLALENGFMHCQAEGVVSRIFQPAVCKDQASDRLKVLRKLTGESKDAPRYRLTIERIT